MLKHFGKRLFAALNYFVYNFFPPNFLLGLWVFIIIKVVQFFDILNFIGIISLKQHANFQGSSPGLLQFKLEFFTRTLFFEGNFIGLSVKIADYYISLLELERTHKSVIIIGIIGR